MVWTFYLRAIRFWLYRKFYLLICFILTLFNSGHITQQYINLQQINGIRTHNHLVRKRTLNYLPGQFGSMFECSFRWFWVRIPFLSLKLQIRRMLRARSSLTFRQTIECRFTLKLVRDMIITYSQTHRTDKDSQHSSIIWPV